MDPYQKCGHSDVVTLCNACMIVRLESQLAASEAKCAEYEAGRRRALSMADEAVTKAETFERERDEARTARAEAERLAVWAVENGAFYWNTPGILLGCDGTPAGILAALRQAEAKGDE